MKKFFGAALGLIMVAACAHRPLQKPASESLAASAKEHTGCRAQEEADQPSFEDLLSAAAEWWGPVHCDVFAGDYEAALEKLQAALKLHSGRGSTSEALAVFLLADVHFRRGDLEKFAAYLRDASTRKSQLPLWIERVELPLRQARWELSQGRKDTYKKLSTEVAQEVSRLRQSNEFSAAELARVFYHLGHFEWRHQEELSGFEEQMDLWQGAQKFLVQSLEVDSGSEAAALILSNYRSILRNIDSWPRELASDPAVSAHRQQEEQWEMVYQTLHLMAQLKVYPLEPGEDSSWLLEHMGELAALEKDLRALYAQPAVSSGLTPASQERRRPLRTLNPEPYFEDPNLK